MIQIPEIHFVVQDYRNFLFFLKTVGFSSRTILKETLKGSEALDLSIGSSYNKVRTRTWRWSTSQIPVYFDFWLVDLAHLLAILAS